MTGDLGTRLKTGFAAAFGGSPTIVARAPGRVNLIGEHTDYNDGFALPVAIGAETRVAVRPRGDGMVHVAALDLGEDDRFSADDAFKASGGWRDYVRGTLAVLRGAGIPTMAVDIAIAGDIPKGTGLSSSASLEVALATAMLAVAGRTADPRQVALWAQAAENDFVGMRCGNLDQLAAAATQERAALLIDCRSLDLTPIAMPADVAVIIVQSGVVRGLVEGEYNLRRQQCEEAARVLGVAALRDVTQAKLDASRHLMSDIVFRRARHIVTDNARALAAADALGRGDLVAMGTLMIASHASQRDDFEITVADTDRLAALMQSAIGQEGGARQTGGGFGGAVVGLMRESAVATVSERILQSYRTPKGETPDIRVERASAGASLLQGQ
ncbi:MAG: galactokinase [Sphingomonadales bacterium]